MSVESKQLAALSFCAASVPAILILPQAGWLCAGAAFVTVAVLFSIAPRSRRNASVILLPLLLWNLLAIGASADQLCRAFPDGNILIGLLLLLLAAYAVGRGVRIVMRVAAIVMIVLIILYGMLLGFSLPEVQKTSFQIVQPTSWLILTSALAPMLCLFLREKDEKPRVLPIFAASILAVLAAVAAAGERDFYTAMKSVSILGAMERLEPLVSIALTLGGFCLLGMICAVNEKIVSQLFPHAKKLTAPINFFLGAASIWLSRLLGDAILAIGTAIFWGLIPILPQSLENQKKFKKNQKNA